MESNLIKCKCGCGAKLLNKDKRGRLRFYIHGHNSAGEKGENSRNWKGDDAKYVGKHRRMYREYGKAIKCEHCHRKDKKKYEWANIGHKYKYDIRDWIQLCTSCHRQMDKKLLNTKYKKL